MKNNSMTGTVYAIKSIPTYEIAEMIGKAHSDVLKMLEGTKRIVGIIPVLTEGNFTLSDYYIESSYKDASGKRNKCYECTKLGCDLLANKLTGEKGILFTAKYVKKFSQMENVMKKQLSPIELLKLQYEVLENHEVEIKNIKHDIDDFRDNAPLFNIECEELQKEVKRMGSKCLGYKSNAYKDRSISQQVYQDIQKEIKRQFGVKSYKAIKRCQLEQAINIVKEYELPLYLKELIDIKNSQAPQIN